MEIHHKNPTFLRPKLRDDHPLHIPADPHIPHRLAKHRPNMSVLVLLLDARGGLHPARPQVIHEQEDLCNRPALFDSLDGHDNNPVNRQQIKR